MRFPSFVVHADWGVSPQKRWLAQATLDPETGGYRVSGPSPVGFSAALLGRLLAAAREAPVLVGFDFPIGLPISYAEIVAIESFKTAVREFGSGRWSDFYSVADTPSEVSLARPFYPNRSSKGVNQKPLLKLVGADEIGALLRACDRATDNRGAACCIFWTLGANQVGKGAISGWGEFVVPALHHDGVSLWPFDGSLEDLLAKDGLVIAETYPREFDDHLDIRLTGPKREQEVRRLAVPTVDRWLARARREGLVELSDQTRLALDDAFGSGTSGEDAFDAFVGLLGMLNIVFGWRSERLSAGLSAERLNVEGWIMGQCDEEVESLL